jgi:sporulation protein YlmC with PRC-barrel domain
MRLSQILGSRVLESDGREAGRVFDVAVRWSSDGLEVEGLVIGTQGLLDRLGYRRAEGGGSEPIPWTRVRQVASDRLLLGPPTETKQRA